MTILALVALVGCGGGGQSYNDAIQVLCDAPNTCTSCKTATPEQKALELAKHIDKGITNADAKKLVAGFAKATAQDRQKQMDEAAMKAGVVECALAKLYAEEAKPDLEKPATVIDAAQQKLVTAAVQAQAAKMTACYTKAIERNPAFEGQATIKFVLDEAGTTLAAQMHESSWGESDQALSACLVDGVFAKLAVSDWKSDGKTIIVYPVVLKKPDPAEESASGEGAGEAKPGDAQEANKPGAE